MNYESGPYNELSSNHWNIGSSVKITTDKYFLDSSIVYSSLLEDISHYYTDLAL